MTNSSPVAFSFNHSLLLLLFFHLFSGITHQIGCANGSSSAAVAEPDGLLTASALKGLETLNKGLHVVNVSDFIDHHIQDIRSALNVDDPAKLPDKEIPNVRQGKLFNGQLKNLRSLSRTGDCSISYVNKILDLSFTMGYDQLLFNYDYILKIVLVPREGKLNGKVHNVSVSIDLQVDFNKYQVVLKNFKFHDVGKIEVEIDGSNEGGFKNIIINYVISLMKNSIMKNMEKTSVEKINDVIKVINESIRSKKSQKQFRFVIARHA